MATIWEQRSFQTDDSRGILYLIPTPIGNLDDITLRALEILKSSDILAAEDTRHTLKLCTHFDIHTPLWSYHEHNKKTSGTRLIAELETGKKVALVTDAGMPGISDPGADLVALCASRRIPVVPLPGASASLTALVASGLPTDHFYFYGFLPREKKEQKSVLTHLCNLSCCLIFYESPFRIKDTLDHILTVMGDREIALARELTKRYESFLRGTVSEVLERLNQEEAIKGEFCLIVSGTKEAQTKEQDSWWTALSIEQHVNFYIEEKEMPVKEAVRQAAADRGKPKREIYRIYHHLDQN